MIEFEIELRKHIGEYHDRRLGRRTVEHPQWRLFYHDAEMEQVLGVPWLHIGYVGHQTDSIEFLNHANGLEKEVIQEICKRVGEKTGRARVAHMPPAGGIRMRAAQIKDLDEDD